MPTSSTTAAKDSAEVEVFSSGLSTTALPAARAGAIFQAASISGEFQGVIAPTTPMGSRSVNTFFVGSSGVIVAPRILSARPA
jgi:hypothetical protein